MAKKEIACEKPSSRRLLASYIWAAEYEELCTLWPWRVAAYIAWKSSPRQSRQPPTQMELARALGLKSDRIIHKWRTEQPEIEEEIKRLQAAPLLAHRRDVYEALLAGALDLRYGHADRKLVLELLGDYRAQADLRVGVVFTADEAAQAEAELREFEAAVGGEQTETAEPE